MSSGIPWPPDVAPKLPVLEDQQKIQNLDEVTKGFRLDLDAILKIKALFEEEMDIGLSTNPNRPGTVQMQNTYVTEVPDGTETGEYLALDLGGSNFRVVHLKLQPGKEPTSTVKHYDVPPAIRTGPGVDLFDFLSDSIKDFIETFNLGPKGQRLPLGFTFSFALDQKALDKGILIAWVLNWSCTDVEGHDVVQLFRDSLNKKDIPVDVVAILNDTSGALMRGAYAYPDCGIGLVIGTGSNIAYLEDIEKVEKWEGDKTGVKQVIIDTEWGGLGDDGRLDFMVTEFDRELDKGSLIPGAYKYEKYTGGQFQGEMVRLTLVRLCKDGVVFGGKLPETMKKPYAFSSKTVSLIEKHYGVDDDDDALRQIHEALKPYGGEFSSDDVKVIRFLCAVVSVRTAILCSLCTAAILQRMKRPHTTISVDGSLYMHHPRLSGLIDDFTKRLAPNLSFQFVFLKDGSGIGAGIVAAVAHRVKKT